MSGPSASSWQDKDFRPALRFSSASFLSPTRHNEPLSDSDIKVTTNALHIASTARDQCRARVVALRAALVEAEEDLVQVEDYISAHKATMSPIRRLPTEVFTQIFQHSFTSTGDGYAFSLTSFHCSPWGISHVCRRWRDVIIECPALWSSFSICFPHDTRHASRLLPIALSRTRQIPLSFSVELHSSFNPEASLSIYRCLMAQAHRWLRVGLYLDELLVSELPSVRGQLALLHRLHITRPDNVDFSSITTLFSTLPNLNHVELLGGELHILDIPWSQLSVINIGAGSVTREFLPALDNAWSLEHLTVECDTAIGLSNKAEAARKGYPLLPSLRFLSTDNARLISLLRLPALEKLVCKNATRRIPDDSPSNVPRTMLVVMKLGRSDFLSLRTLHIFDGETTSNSMLAVMKVVANLEELEIYVRGRMRVQYFEPLISPLTSQPFILPKLRLLSFIDEPYGYIRAFRNTPTKSVELLDMVEARRPTLEALTVVFDDPFEFSPDLLLRLRALESGGFSWTQTAPVHSGYSDSLGPSDIVPWSDDLDALDDDW
ncbi:hypothetical protein CPB85DRAFT_1350217 [Mucidula mucida]|nr:hypothetical protein CPB85DRAFT_1350217 [Mucidula mucida]